MNNTNAPQSFPQIKVVSDFTWKTAVLDILKNMNSTLLDIRAILESSKELA
ncbi:MAG: hypothetical protein ABJB85_07305 [Nitrososphaerota archaeon]